MTEIVKAQGPMMSNGEHPPWLMYDEARKHVTKVDHRVVPQYVKDAMGDDFEAYFVGAWSSIVGWGVSERVADQEW